VGNDSVAISVPTYTQKRRLPDGSVALFFLVEPLGDELFDESLVTLVPSSGKGPDPLKGRFIEAHGHILGPPARRRQTISDKRLGNVQELLPQLVGRPKRVFLVLGWEVRNVREAPDHLHRRGTLL
jgi:hypothetical protein